MPKARKYREVKCDTLNWIIIDDRTADLEKLAKELHDLGVKPEKIHGFKLDSQCGFASEKKKDNSNPINELLDLNKVPKPAFDYLGYTYGFVNEEWKKFESNVESKLYLNVLYPIVSCESDEDKNFIFLIDLDFDNKSFCGFDILTLLRKTLNPLNYQVRFITNVARRSVKKIIDEEYGDNFAILGDNNHLSFISKDSAFRQLPIITKDYYNQFTSTFIEKDQKSIYDVYKSSREDKVVCLSDKDINIKIGEQKYQQSKIIRIKNLNELENEIKNSISKPTIVVVNLDLYGDNPLKGIWKVESISKKISMYEIQGFSVYFVTFKTKEEREKDATWKAISRSHWKTFLHSIDEKSGLQVDVANISSPIYWKFKISISPYRQFKHDLRYALDPKNEDKSDELIKIRGDIEAYLSLIDDSEVKKLQTTLRLREKELLDGLSIDIIEDSLEQILWVVVGIDEDSVKGIVDKLEDEAKILVSKKYLNKEDKFIALVVEETEKGFKEQIEFLEESENTVFLFDDVMPCYRKILETSINVSKEGNTGKTTKAHEILVNGHAENYWNFNDIKKVYGENYFDKIKRRFDEAHNIVKDNKNSVDVFTKIKWKFREAYIDKIKTPFDGAFAKIQEQFKGAHNIIEKNKIKELFDKAFKIIEESFEKEYYATALEKIKEELPLDMSVEQTIVLKQFVNERFKDFQNNFAYDKFTDAIHDIKELFDEVNKRIQEKLDNEVFITKKETFEKENFTKASETDSGELKKNKFTKALEIIKDVFEEKNFTYRILERSTWALIEGGSEIEFCDDDEKKQRKEYEKAKKGFKLNHKCLDFFIYSWPEENESFFTIDRLFFMREDLKIPKSFAHNPAFDKLKSDMRNGSPIPQSYVDLQSILFENKAAEWQTIIWGSNYRSKEEDNQGILINRLCILEFVCKNFKSMPSNFCDQNETLFSQHWKRNCLPVTLAQFNEIISNDRGPKSKIKVRDFLHRQYAFDIWQENKERNKKGKENVIFITISPDSLFYYEKNYLWAKFKDDKNNSQIYDWLNGGKSGLI